MDSNSIARVRRSFELLGSRVGVVTARFHDELFRTSPETRRLFGADMDAHRKHLAAALAVIVRNLAVLDALEEPLRALGAGHARAGVRPRDYPVVCDVMVRAMGDVLDDAWTDELAADWRAVLATVSRHMLAGASEANSR